MRTKLCFTVIVALILFSANAFADTVVGSGGWNIWTTAVLDENQNPYWDGNSFDSGSPYNIGNYLTNTGGFSGGSGPGVAYDYWGTKFGGPDPFSLHWISGSNNVAMQLEVAGYAGSNIFGYYDSKGYHLLFSGSQTSGATATFTPTEDYVFYLTSPDGTFKTDESGADDTYEHFAIFKEADGIYWIGMEDLKTGSDYDYNDMIVKISQVSIPEPATMLLLGLGLVGLAGIGRKFKR